MPRLKWEHHDTRMCCYSADKKIFFGSYFENVMDKWLAHICPKDIDWYTREYPLKTAEKIIKSDCQRFINHFEKEKDKWERE